MFTPEQVVELLDPDAWDVVTQSAPTREMAGPEGPVTRARLRVSVPYDAEPSYFDQIPMRLAELVGEGLGVDRGEVPAVAVGDHVADHDRALVLPAHPLGRVDVVGAGGLGRLDGHIGVVLGGRQRGPQTVAEVGGVGRQAGARIVLVLRQVADQHGAVRHRVEPGEEILVAGPGELVVLGVVDGVRVAVVVVDHGIGAAARRPPPGRVAAPRSGPSPIDGSRCTRPTGRHRRPGRRPRSGRRCSWASPGRRCGSARGRRSSRTRGSTSGRGSCRRPRSSCRHPRRRGHRWRPPGSRSRSRRRPARRREAVSTSGVRSLGTAMSLRAAITEACTSATVGSLERW